MTHQTPNLKHAAYAAAEEAAAKHEAARRERQRHDANLKRAADAKNIKAWEPWIRATLHEVLELPLDHPWKFSQPHAVYARGGGLARDTSVRAEADGVDLVVFYCGQVMVHVTYAGPWNGYTYNRLGLQRVYSLAGLGALLKRSEELRDQEMRYAD